MRCPTCAVDDDRVVDSRPAADGTAIRRRRECLGCGGRFTTFERVELPVLHVRKRSGVAVPFDRQKVLDGMARAASQREPSEALQRAAVAVEARQRELGTAEVTTEQVGLEVLAQLHDIDTVAYVRFASVYRDFQDTQDFEQELVRLRKDQPPKPVEPS